MGGNTLPIADQQSWVSKESSSIHGGSFRSIYRQFHEPHTHRLGQGAGLISMTLRMTLYRVHLEHFSVRAEDTRAEPRSSVKEIWNEPEMHRTCVQGHGKLKPGE